MSSGQTIVAIVDLHRHLLEMQEKCSWCLATGHVNSRNRFSCKQFSGTPNLNDHDNDKGIKTNLMPVMFLSLKFQIGGQAKNLIKKQRSF